MNDYPTYSVKVTVQMHSNLNPTHECLTEHNLLPRFRHLTEIEAVKSAIDALRVRYCELDKLDKFENE